MDDQKLSNPAPLGLMAFGMTTVLLNIHNAGFFPMTAMILAMGLFYGGIAQIIAGILEFRTGNTFGMTAFCSYGLFWLTLVFIVAAGELGFMATAPAFMGWYLFLWGLFTFGMFFGTLKHNRALQVVFATLTVLFWLLAAANWTGSATIALIAGYEGIVCGLSAMYTSIALVLKADYGHAVLPIGEPPYKPLFHRRDESGHAPHEGGHPAAV